MKKNNFFYFYVFNSEKRYVQFTKKLNTFYKSNYSKILTKKTLLAIIPTKISTKITKNNHLNVISKNNKRGKTKIQNKYDFKSLL